MEQDEPKIDLLDLTKADLVAMIAGLIEYEKVLMREATDDNVVDVEHVARLKAKLQENL